MEKIRVAFFADILTENFDGAVRTIYQIINRINSDQFEFLFFCGSPPISNFKFPYFEVPSIEIPRNEDYKVAIPALAIFDLNSRMNEFNPHIIHISSPSFLGKFALDYGNWNKIPIITIYHTHFISYIDYYLKEVKFLIDPVKAFVISRNKSFYNNCDITLVPSNALLEELISYEFTKEKLKVWRRGINTELFSPSKKNLSIGESLKIKKPIVLFASRLVWEKNLKTLIEVYNLNQISKEFQLVIAGDGVAKIELQEKMPDAKFLGKLSHEDLSKWYASSDIFMFTSDTETYGNVVVEAMASGLPVVVANAGGPMDLVVHGETGMKCDPNNAQEFIDNIHLILKDELYKNKLISNGLSFASRLSWDSLMVEYFGYIRDLINK